MPLKYRYIQDKPAAATNPNPHADKNPAMVTNSTVLTGIHMGLEMRINGIKRMRLTTVAVTVRPVRIRRIDAETKRVKKPRSWVEFGAWSWIFRKKVEAVGLGLLGLGALCWPAGFRSAMVESLIEG